MVKTSSARRDFLRELYTQDAKRLKHQGRKTEAKIARKHAKLVGVRFELDRMKQELREKKREDAKWHHWKH